MAFVRARVLMAASVAVGVSGCSLLLDFDAEISDAAPGPPADADPDAPDAAPTPQELYEPNDTQASARPIDFGVVYGPAAIRPQGDKDFFAFSLDTAKDVTIDLTFKHADGDLELRLYDAAMTEIAKADSLDDNEQIVRPFLPAGMYAVRVAGFNDMRVSDRYTLEITTP